MAGHPQRADHAHTERPNKAALETKTLPFRRLRVDGHNGGFDGLPVSISNRFLWLGVWTPRSERSPQRRSERRCGARRRTEQPNRPSDKRNHVRAKPDARKREWWSAGATEVRAAEDEAERRPTAEDTCNGQPNPVTPFNPSRLPDSGLFRMPGFCDFDRAIFAAPRTKGERA